MHQSVGRGSAASASLPRANQFGIRTERRPCPNIAELPLFVGGNVLLLRIAEGPNFVALNTLAGQINQHRLLIVLACLSDLRQELENGIESHVAHAGRAAKRVPLN